MNDINKLKSFYEKWAENQRNDPRREIILKWKAVNMANLIFRTLADEIIDTVCEIGGAEGIVINTLGNLINAKYKLNYEISTKFCQLGKAQYPDIEFKNSEFDYVDIINKPKMLIKYDLIILSDITEHVIDDILFLRAVGRSCKYVVLKMPIEKCIMDSEILYWLCGRIKPKNKRYGSKHYNRHLRGYTIKSALNSLSPFFEIIDYQVSDVTYFYPSPKSIFIKKILGSRITSHLFGGALFVLGVAK
jgi:hypothetical protein